VPSNTVEKVPKSKFFWRFKFSWKDWIFLANDPFQQNVLHRIFSEALSNKKSFLRGKIQFGEKIS
jgi:hypothetical protein